MTPDIQNDNVPNGTKTNFYFTVDLLVSKEINILSNKTSDPKRTSEAMSKYLGLLSYHQYKLGLKYFMCSMLNREIFSHEIEVIALKMLHGFK